MDHHVPQQTRPDCKFDAPSHSPILRELCGSGGRLAWMVVAGNPQRSAAARRLLVITASAAAAAAAGAVAARVGRWWHLRQRWAAEERAKREDKDVVKDENKATPCGTCALAAGEETKRLAAIDDGVERTSPPEAPTPTLHACPWHDAVAFFLPSADLGRVACTCAGLRMGLTVEMPGRMDGGVPQRRLLVPAVELSIETAEAELHRVSIPHIHILRVWNRPSFDSICAAAVDGQGLRSLDKFVCKGCHLSAGDVTKLLVPTLGCTAVLKLLNLEKCKLQDAAVRELCNSGILARVETLNLRFNMIGDEGAIALSSGQGAASLRWINLKMNRVGDEGAVALARLLHGNTSMTLLNLRAQTPGLSDRAALAFAQALRTNCSLSQLRLRRNRITSKGAEALAAAAGERLRHLGTELPTSEPMRLELDLEGNRICERGALALLQAASMAPLRARVEILLYGNLATRDGLCLAVANARTPLDAQDARVSFESKPEASL